MKNNTVTVVFLLSLLCAAAYAGQNESCALAGVSPPCDEITLNEAVYYINAWNSGNAPLGNVIHLLIAWATQEETLRGEYQAAIRDAETANESEICRHLTPITESNPNLTWEEDNGSTRVLVVTWTAWGGYVNQTNNTMNLTRETWVTVYSEVRDFIGRNALPAEKCSLRLEQLNGLPPRNNKTWFVELFVSPQDMFRPSPDPEINDTEAQLDFPADTSQEHIDWINNLKNSSYGTNGYPWTQLGYTYDWATNSQNHVGLSEYVIRKGSIVKIHDTISTNEYCSS